MVRTGGDVIRQITDSSMNRRILLRRAALGLGVMAFVPLLGACAEDDDDVVADEEVADDSDPAVEPDDDEDEVVDDEVDDEDEAVDDAVDDEGRYGGTLHVAMHDVLPPLDVQAVQSISGRMIGHHVFETLIAYGEDYSMQPGLAQTWDWSDDGATLTLGLRENVMFHNGDTLTADDVIASLDRYTEYGSRDVFRAAIDEATEIDENTVEISLVEPNSGFLPILASPLVNVAIHPREHIEDKEPNEPGVEDYIGTGPFQVEEHVGDSHILLRRFDDYYETDGERNGYSGSKTPYLDEIIFHSVAEVGSRVSGLLAGDYHFIGGVPGADRDRLDNDPDVSPSIGGPGVWFSMEFNHHPDSGLSANRTFRQAVQARADMQQFANLIVGPDEDLYRMNPSIYRPEQADWYTEVAADLWNQNDPDRAQELLEEAGYDGEPFIIAYGEGPDADAMATGLAEQLRDIGVEVETMTMDWPSLLAFSQEPEGWHIRTDTMTVRFTPADWDATLNCGTGRVHWCNEELEEVLEELKLVTEVDEQKPLSDEIQRIHHEEVFSLKMPDTFGMNALANDVSGYEPWYLERFWGVWLEDQD